VVVGCLESFLIEFITNFFTLFSGKTVDDSCFIFVSSKNLLNLF